jgi:hypothetical protein
MIRNVFAIYAPPTLGLPYLAAMIKPNGKVTVEPFDTAPQADAHNRTVEALLYRGDDAPEVKSDRPT